MNSRTFNDSSRISCHIQNDNHSLPYNQYHSLQFLIAVRSVIKTLTPMITTTHSASLPPSLPVVRTFNDNPLQRLSSYIDNHLFTRSIRFITIPNSHLHPLPPIINISNDNLPNQETIIESPMITTR